MKNKTPYNSTFAIGGVSYSAESFVVAKSFVFRINFCAKKQICKPLGDIRHFSATEINS